MRAPDMDLDGFASTVAAASDKHQTWKVCVDIAGKRVKSGKLDFHDALDSLALIAERHDWFGEFMGREKVEQYLGCLPKEADPAGAETSRFKLTPFDGVSLSAVNAYLVKGLIPRVGLTVIWGPPKCRKSFWTFDLVMHIPLNREYRGRRVVPGPVVYCAFEGAEGFKARIAAFRSRHMNG